MKSYLIIFCFLLGLSGRIFAGDDHGKTRVKVISGRVIDPRGEALPGTKITLKNTGEYCYTDLEGNYQIELPANQVVEITFNTIGYEPKEVKSDRIFLFGEQVLEPLK